MKKSRQKLYEKIVRKPGREEKSLSEEEEEKAYL